jgi:hypothetical protein
MFEIVEFYDERLHEQATHEIMLLRGCKHVSTCSNDYWDSVGGISYEDACNAVTRRIIHHACAAIDGFNLAAESNANTRRRREIADKAQRDMLEVERLQSLLAVGRLMRAAKSATA